MDNFDWIEILIIVICVTIGYLSGRKGQREQTSGQFVPQRGKEVEPNQTDKYDAKGENSLPVSIIRELGIQYELLDDGRCFFTYQGENLYLDYSNEDTRFFRIVDIMWLGVPLDDIDKVCLVQKVINTCNTMSTCKYVYSIDKEDNSLDVSSIRELFLSPNMTEAKEYMRITLDVLMHSHQTFYAHMDETRQKEYESREHI